MTAGATAVTVISPSVQITTDRTNIGRVNAKAANPKPVPSKSAAAAIALKRGHLPAALLTWMLNKTIRMALTVMANP
jgi:hypothetical protein